MSRARDTADQINRVNSSAADATAITVDSSENVGIGTSSPSSYYSTDLVVAVPDEGGITLVNDTTHTSYLMFADGTSGADRYRGQLSYDHNVNGMAFATNGNERMRIDLAGKVGIGDSSPSARLEIGGMAAGEQALLIQSGRNDALSNGLARINITDSNCPFVGLQVDHAGTGDAIKATGKIRATSFYGDGSNLTGVGGSTTYGAVGTYGIFHILPGTYVGVAAGGTTSASNLKNYVQSGYGGYPFQKFGTNGSDYSSASLSGTWRNMSGPLGVHSSDASNQMVGSIWVRIS